jgi:hypothetical protein
MDRWIEAIGDQPNLPEAKLIEQLWNGSDSKPVTKNPIISISDGIVTISCDTEGASIGYMIIGQDGNEPKAWEVYQAPFALPSEAKLMVQSHRIGFVKSKIVKTQG